MLLIVYKNMNLKTKYFLDKIRVPANPPALDRGQCPESQRLETQIHLLSLSSQADTHTHTHKHAILRKPTLMVFPPADYPFGKTNTDQNCSGSSQHFNVFLKIHTRRAIVEKGIYIHTYKFFKVHICTFVFLKDKK